MILMVSPFERLLKIAIPLTQSDRSRAREFAQYQSDLLRNESTYLNTLAVLSTQRYLQMINVEADLSKSYSWNVANRMIGDISDLYIPECDGRIECRPVLPGSKTCWIPKELWTDRIGYLVVEIDDEQSQGVLLGFFQTVSNEAMPLSNLQPLDRFIDAIEHSNDNKTESKPNDELTRLLDWLDGVVNNHWNLSGALPQGGIVFAASQLIRQNLTQLYAIQFGKSAAENLVSPNMNDSDALAYLIQSTNDEGIRRQAVDLLQQLDPYHSLLSAVREKDLSIHIEGHSIALRVMLIPLLNQRYSVLVRVYATGDERFLPEGLQLTVLNEDGDEQITHTARAQDDWMDRPIVVDAGDRFGIRIALNGVCTTEAFIV
jgi:hypothetical protein